MELGRLFIGSRWRVVGQIDSQPMEGQTHNEREERETRECDRDGELLTHDFGEARERDEHDEVRGKHPDGLQHPRTL